MPDPFIIGMAIQVGASLLQGMFGGDDAPPRSAEDAFFQARVDSFRKIGKQRELNIQLVSKATGIDASRFRYGGDRFGTEGSKVTNAQGTVSSGVKLDSNTQTPGVDKTIKQSEESIVKAQTKATPGNEFTARESLKVKSPADTNFTGKKDLEQRVSTSPLRKKEEENALNEV